MTGYRPPRDCPVCSSRLNITQLGCPNCGTGLSGQFVPCEFCGLDDSDRGLLRVFLASRGNMKDVERFLGVSYPTARARFDDLLRRLDLGEPGAGGQAGAGPGGRAQGGTRPAAAGPSGSRAAADPRLETLRAVARGDLDVDQARNLLEPGR